VRPTEKRSDRHHRRRNGVQRETGESRVRFLCHLRESQLLERHSRQVQHGRAARFLFSVDVVHVFLGARRDALARFLKHLFTVAVAEGVRRARFDAGRHLDRVAERLAFLRGERLAIARGRKRLVAAVRAVRALVNLGTARIPVG
jgi:hypothetical protein